MASLAVAKKAFVSQPAFRLAVQAPALKNVYVPLPSSEETKLTSFAQPEYRGTVQTRINRSFELNIGAKLSIPTLNARERPTYSQPAQQQQDAVRDPFEGLPFRAFAERMGEAMMPIAKALREDQRRSRLQGKEAAASAVPEAPPVPHLLPFTRWAANSERIRATFVAEHPLQRKKARLSWWHPDDGMVPRGWFKDGLLADIKYYMPFAKPPPQQQQTATA